MGILDKAKEALAGPSVIVWKCNSCGETFETSRSDMSKAPSEITCQKCGAADIQELKRKHVDE